MAGAQAPALKNKKIMRKSLADFIDKCLSIRKHLNVSSFELHDHADGAHADFRVYEPQEISRLAITTQGYDVRVFAEENYLIIRIYEKYND